MMHRMTRSLGAGKVHRNTVPSIRICLYLFTLCLCTSLTSYYDDKRGDMLMDVTARGETPQQYWDVTSWLDTEASTQPRRLTLSAKKDKYMCNSYPTSIETTIAANNNMDSHNSIMLASTSPPRLSSKRWPTTEDHIPVYITFRAYSNETKPQTSGGDVFVVQMQIWTVNNNTTASVKTAAYTNDNLDGTYSATIFLPRVPMHYLNATLRHYYTCHTGLQLPAELRRSTNYNMHHRMNFGPMIWPKLQHSIFQVSKSLDSTREVVKHIKHPCSSFDETLFGVWQEERVDYPADLSTKGAEWNPIFCDKVTLPNFGERKAYRIGDSTMPNQLAEVGYPFSFHKGEDWDGKLLGSNSHDKSYAEALWGTLRNASEHDRILYGGGLHHLFHGNFNPKSTAKLIMKAACQIALVFPGDVVQLRGPNPIQQHLHATVDQTALSVRMINWELRAMLNRHDYKLDKLCEHLITVDDISISSLEHKADDNGDMIWKEHYTSTDYESPSQVSLSKYLQGLSLSVNDRQRLYRNRTVRWIDTESFFLPRSEEYRENDKIHDGIDFMFFPHHEMYEYLERMPI